MMKITEKIKEIKDFLKNVPKELSECEHSTPLPTQSSPPSNGR